METEHGTPWKVWLRKFLIELVLYGFLVVGYFFIVLRYLGDPLARLFQENLKYYAIASLLLIVAGFRGHFPARLLRAGSLGIGRRLWIFLSRA